MASPPLAPDWHVERWFNTPSPLTLADLRGKVVLSVAFQNLCWGGIPITRLEVAQPELFRAGQEAATHG